MRDLIQGPAIDVAIIGAGPAGLAAAGALKAAGVARVVVLERERDAGGIPRHCGHPPFGLRAFHRILKGPEFAARLVARARAAGVEIHTQTTVIEALAGGALSLATPTGPCRISARRVIYATGVREQPRAARLISGARVGGVLNTGALQSLVYLKQRRPFVRPVIAGSELVAFSALMTCQHAGIRPVAMIEPGPDATARWPSALYARLKGVPLLRNTKLVAIEGAQTVQAVRVLPSGPARARSHATG
jgi:NADPH-dependent 2,4-dienoyl-CoA reductase/sulfur reductase-like enzyme